METKNKTEISKDLKNKQLTVVREFNASVKDVWSAWTESDKLDQWWAPKPWRAKTKKMDFREGGSWLYSMIGPDGTEVWSCAEYDKIIPGKMFSGIDAFCDENGNINNEFPKMHWDVTFKNSESGTMVQVLITFNDEADMKKIIEMGFEEGFTSAHGNLDDLLSKDM